MWDALAGGGFTILGLSLGGTLLYFLIRALEKAAGGKIRPKVAYYLWVLVLIRLVLPFGPEVSLLAGLSHWIAPESQAQWIGAGNGEEEAALALELGVKSLLAGQRDEPGLEEGAFQGARGRLEETSVGANAYLESGNIFSPGSPFHSDNPLFGSQIVNGCFALGGLIWLLGILWVMAGKWLAYRLFVKKLSMRSRRVEDPRLLEIYGSAWRQLEERKGKKRKGVEGAERRLPQILTSQVDTSPILLGIRRPRIFLPEEMVCRFMESTAKEDGLRHILMHELVHYMRGDILYKWIVQAVCAVHWFNPVMRRLSQKIERDCELSCDERMCTGLTATERNRYGSALLEVLWMTTEFAEPPQALKIGPCTAIGTERKWMKERLYRIRGYRGSTKMERMISILLALAVISCGVLIGSWGVPEKAAAEGPSLLKEEEAINRMASSLKVEVLEDGMGKVSFTVPEAVSGYAYRVHAAGRAWTDAEKTSAMSWHIFPEEEGRDLQPGRVISGTFPVRNMDDYTLSFSLVAKGDDEEEASFLGSDAYRLSMRMSGLLSPGGYWGEEEAYPDAATAYEAVLRVSHLQEEGMGYAFYDIDANGIPELIVGPAAGVVISYVYTFVPDEGGTGGCLRYVGDMENPPYPVPAEEEGDGVYTYGGFGTGVGASLYYRLAGNVLIEEPGNETASYTTPPGMEVQYYLQGKNVRAEAYERFVEERFGEEKGVRWTELGRTQEGAR